MASKLVDDVSENNVGDVLDRSVRFTVPDYQRLYSWEESQWQEFWRDLIELEEGESHFLGSIVVIGREGGFGKLDKYELVDGQQRLTTISLILKAIQSHFNSSNDPNDIADMIDDDYLYESDQKNEQHIKLSLSRFENETYGKIVEDDISNINEESQLIKGYNYFRDKLSGLSDDEIEEVRMRLVLSMNLVVIECSSTASAFRLFETLNDRGLELSAVDLMKNSLLQVASEKLGDGDDYDYIRSKWEEVLEEVVYEIDKPDRFFKHYIMSRPHPDIEGSVTSRKLYDEFNDIIKNKLPTNGTDLTSYIEGMVDEAGVYVGLTNASVDQLQGRQRQKINNRLQNLNDIGSTHSRTLLLRTFNEFEEFSDINQILKYIEVFMIRWKLANYQSGTGLDKIFSNICSYAFTDGEPMDGEPIDEIKQKLSEEAPSDEEVYAGLANESFSRNSQTTYILDIIESYHFMTGEGAGAKSYNRATVDIEHIAPRATFTAKKYSPWREALGVDKDGFEQYKNRLGNLTLLEDRLNEKASDRPFQQKKDQYKLADFQMTQNIREEYDIWTKNEIEQRSKDLAEIGVNIWDFDTY